MDPKSSSDDLDPRALADALRAGRDSLSDPDFSALAAHLADHPEDEEWIARGSAFDARLAAAIEDVPAPVNLAARLLDALATAKAADGHPADVQPTGVQPSAVDFLPSTAAAAPGAAPCAGDEIRIAPAAEIGREASPRRTRRLWWATAAALLIACGVGFFALNSSAALTPAQAMEEARQCFGDVVARLAAREWQPLGTAPAELRFSSALDMRYANGWQSYDRFRQRGGVVYALEGPRGVPQGLLFVVREPRAIDFPTGPGKTQNTGGLWTTAWKQDSVLYALVVKGDRDQVESVRNFQRRIELTMHRQ